MSIFSTDLYRLHGKRDPVYFEHRCVFEIYHMIYNMYVCVCVCSVVQFSSVTQSCLTLCDPMNRSTPGLPIPSPIPRVHSDSRPSSQWCHPAISSSVIPFSSSIPPNIRVFFSESPLHNEVAKVLEFQL